MFGVEMQGQAGYEDKITPSSAPSLSSTGSPPRPSPLLLNQTFPTRLQLQEVLSEPATMGVGGSRPQRPLTSTFCLTSSRLARRWLSVFWAYSMWLQYLP